MKIAVVVLLLCYTRIILERERRWYDTDVLLNQRSSYYNGTILTCISL